MTPSRSATLIFAADERGLLGRASGKLPWDIPENREYFWRTFYAGDHHTIVMGRATYDGLVARGLFRHFAHHRSIAVLTSTPIDNHAVLAVQSLEALAASLPSSASAVIVIGGAQTFQAFCEPNPHFHISRIDRTAIHLDHAIRDEDVVLPECLRISPAVAFRFRRVGSTTPAATHTHEIWEHPSTRARTKVILLNGPPGSGKDTAADFIVGRFGARKLEFKNALHHLVCEHFGLDYGAWMRDYDNRALKEMPRADLGDRTPRQAMIHVSEEIVKPRHGNGYFALRTLDRMHHKAIHVISDCGFGSEVETMAAAFHDVLVIKLVRTGCSFDGDSRNYVDASRHGTVREVTCLNNGTHGELFAFCEGAVSMWDQ